MTVLLAEVNPMFTCYYAVGTLAYIAIWIALYVLLPRSRPAILWTGLIFAPAGIISEYWSLVDY